MNKELQCIQEKWQDLIRKRRMIRAATSGAATMVTSSSAESTSKSVTSATPAPTTVAVTTSEAPKPTPAP
ncbi:hypothetical protein OESDEN_24068 [Oesophagostomum dentatum]|uniref:Uncharacterized protein n=1 Tax=Oesophagostomum dentatum TaxID=61180 RepID=A0A0B1RYL4_OESDE|nr:hypothetical protein OESDEN_24068 [Oesophagostomum dentatum]